MEKVLVTGGAGYVGSVLVPHLLEEGYAVRVLDRFRHRSPGLIACVGHPHFEAVRGDAGCMPLVNRCLKDVDWVIPLAALVGAPACEQNPGVCWSINFHTISVMESYLSPNQGLLFPNTNSGYGQSPAGKVCDENTPLDPISDYGKSKMHAERAIFRRDNALSFRFATAFGPSSRMRLDLLVNDFTYRAVRDKCVVLYEPHFRRNYIHVKDIARAFVHAMQNWDAMKGQVYNCGLDVTRTKAQLCQNIKDVVPDFQWLEALVGEDPDKRDYEVSSEKLFSTGFRLRYTLQQGIRELVQAYMMFPGPEFTNL